MTCIQFCNTEQVSCQRSVTLEIESFVEQSKKVKLSLRLINKHHDIKTYGGVEVYFHHSWPRHLGVSGHLHDQAALFPGEEPPVSIGY
jgi:hypothetical protein